MLGFDFSMGPQHPLSVNVWITCWYHEFSIWKNEIHHFHPPSILLPANSYDWSHYPFSHQVPCHGPYLIFLRLSQGVPNWHLVFFSPAVLDFYCCISCYHEFIEASTMHIYYLPGPWEDRCAQLSSLPRVSQSNCWPVWCFHLRAPEKKIPFQAHPFSAISASCEIEVSSSCSPWLISAPGKPWTFLLCAPLYVYLAMKNFFHVYWNTSTLFL